MSFTMKADRREVHWIKQQFSHRQNMEGSSFIRRRKLRIGASTGQNGRIEKLLSGDSEWDENKSARIKKQTLAYEGHVLKKAPEYYIQRFFSCFKSFLCIKGHPNIF